MSRTTRHEIEIVNDDAASRASDSSGVAGHSDVEIAPPYAACPTCRGTGGGQWNDCRTCDGNGVV